MAVTAGMVAILAGCGGSNPTVGEALDRTAPAICEKLKECNSTAFEGRFPNGNDECAQFVKDEMKKRIDLNATSKCDNDTLDKCVADLKAAQCPADSALPTPPCDC